VDNLDLSAVDFWGRSQADRDAAFRHLRSLPGPAFFREAKIPFVKKGPGYYALVRHADVAEASRLADVFSSEPTSNSIPDMPKWVARYFGSMINMDDPRHARIRGVVTRAFTPRMMTRLDADLRAIAAQLVDDLIKEGHCDFVPAIAARLPVAVICAMMGIPDSSHQRVFELSNRVLGNIDPEYTGVKPGSGRITDTRSLIGLIAAGRELHRIATRLGRERQTTPTDDLTSALVNAHVDGTRLTEQEIGSFFILLVVAGAETTRTALAHALHLFTEHPDQLDLLRSDFDAHLPGAVEEIVRYATPVIQFRRTLTRDHRLKTGHRLAKGDKVLLFYNSANRDDAVFKNPDAFDITRRAKSHVGFGGHGPHYCLGANLARLEISVMLRELYTRLPKLHSVGDPERLLSGFINGIKHIECAW
jgi:Cytochrome P450